MLFELLKNRKFKGYEADIYIYINLKKKKVKYINRLEI